MKLGTFSSHGAGDTENPGGPGSLCAFLEGGGHCHTQPTGHHQGQCAMAGFYGGSQGATLLSENSRDLLQQMGSQYIPLRDSQLPSGNLT